MPQPSVSVTRSERARDCAIVRGGSTTTNYQILPGDRIYVQAQTLVTLNNIIGKVAAPLERMFGVTLLGSETVQQLAHPNNNGGNGGFR